MKIEIGKVIHSSDAPERDAIHVAVYKAHSQEQLQPGQPVRLNASGRAVPAGTKNRIGIVDPFLKAPVESWESFWLFLDPGTTENLRHDWDHPDIPRSDVDFEFEDGDTDDGCRGC